MYYTLRYLLEIKTKFCVHYVLRSLNIVSDLDKNNDSDSELNKTRLAFKAITTEETVEVTTEAILSTTVEVIKTNEVLNETKGNDAELETKTVTEKSDDDLVKLEKETEINKKVSTKVIKIKLKIPAQTDKMDDIVLNSISTRGSKVKSNKTRL